MGCKILACVLNTKQLRETAGGHFLALVALLCICRLPDDALAIQALCDNVLPRSSTFLELLTNSREKLPTDAALLQADPGTSLTCQAQSYLCSALLCLAQVFLALICSCLNPQLPQRLHPAWSRC
jgi:hypothetical protein